MNSVMKVLLGASLAAALNVGCSDDDDEGTQHNDAGGARLDASVGSDGSIDARANSADAALAMTEPQVVGLAIAINDGEIMAGQLAATKATNQAVKNYASMMVAMHTAADQRAAALGIAPATSTPASEVQRMTTLVLQALQNTPASAEFDSSYVESQIVMHMAALHAFDSMLIPNASTPALKAELTSTRSEVQTHLDEAQALRGDGG
jgi:putative membrane protein